MFIGEVDEIGFDPPASNAFPYVEPEPCGFVLIAVAETMEQGTGEVHLDFTFGVEPDGHQVLEPLLRGPWVRAGVIWRRHHGQAEHHPVLKPGLGHRRLSADAATVQETRHKFLALDRPGLKPEQLTQPMTAHPPRTLRAHLYRPLDASYDIFRIFPLRHDLPSALLTSCTRATTQRYEDQTVASGALVPVACPIGW